MAGAECCANPPTLSSSSGAGSVVEFGGLKTYVTGPSDSKRAILLISDVYGENSLRLSIIYLLVLGDGLDLVQLV